VYVPDAEFSPGKIVEILRSWSGLARQHAALREHAARSAEQGWGQRMMARTASHFAKRWSCVLLGSGSR
jgi:hypothetical protein